MVDDRPEATGPSPDSDRPRREPPTIDLKPTEVSTEPQQAAAEQPASPEAAPEPAPEPISETAAAEPDPVAPAPAHPISPWVIAPMSGAVAAALVIGVGWLLGWPAVQPATAPSNAAAIDELTGRIAGLEAKLGKPAAPVLDPVVAARIDALEKSLAATRSQSERLSAALNDAKTAPRPGGPAPDLSGITSRIATLETALQAQKAEIAQQGNRIAATDTADARPADDVVLRRLVAAALLDVLVRIGDPYQPSLDAAKSLAPAPDSLKPLDAFAARGVPNAARLCSELLMLVPKLSPPPPDGVTPGNGIVERLQAGAAKLVRIERTDTVGSDRGAVVARVTAAALHNDLPEARRELLLLSPADRAAAQGWLDKADARDAALAASRQFASDAMADLAKPAQ